jgi:hypothetical protein
LGPAASFGEEEGETLPSGVTEAELLAACVGPGLDYITATAVLAQLRTRCLYLHFDGLRYCFKKDPNVNKLVEEAEQAVAREEVEGKEVGPVRGRIKNMLEERLAKHNERWSNWSSRPLAISSTRHSPLWLTWPTSPTERK